MEMRRERLDRLLKETVGAGHSVYFQPPEGLRLSYPCLVYVLDDLFSKHADNLPYFRALIWKITYITPDPDDEVILKLADLPQCAMGRSFTSDHLYHYPYTIHY